jgi:hypothetical protein
MAASAALSSNSGSVVSAMQQTNIKLQADVPTDITPTD